MIDILRVEFFRLIKSKLFWIMLAICFAAPILLSLALVGLVSLIDAIGGTDSNNISYLLHTIGVTPLTLSELPNVSGNIFLLSLISSSVILSKEFTDGTMRNAILANKSRKQLFFAYLIVAIFIGIAYLLTYFISTLIFVLPIFGFNDLPAGDAATGFLCSLALGICAVVFVQTCVIMFLFSVRKQWATVLFPILITRFVPALFSIIVSIITVGEAFQGNTLSEAFISWMPFVNASLFNAAAVNGALVGKILLYYAIFSGVFIVSGYFTFEKADLK